MKKIISLLTGILFISFILLSFCSCDLPLSSTSSTKKTTAPSNSVTTTTKRPVNIITEPLTTSPSSAYSLFIGVLDADKGKDGKKKAFLYDGDGDGIEELFIVTAYDTRGVCDVYRAENGKVSKIIDGCSVFDGTAEEYYAGVAVKDGQNYLFTYGKTRYGSEYTVRYAFTDLKTAETATVAEDYRRKDGSTDKSVHEYSVNGESVTENEYIVSREAYSVVCATEKTDKEKIKTVGMTITDMIKELEKR